MIDYRIEVKELIKKDINKDILAIAFAVGNYYRTDEIIEIEVFLKDDYSDVIPDLIASHYESHLKDSEKVEFDYEKFSEIKEAVPCHIFWRRDLTLPEIDGGHYE